MSPASRAGVIAHRGASAYAPENTLAAFSAALDMGARAIEFDVQQSSDGRLVVIHDADLKRVAGLERLVGDMTFAELCLTDAGSWFAPAFKDERVPALEAVLDLCEARAPGRLELHLELKQAELPYPGIEARALDALRARPAWADRVVISSFDRRTLRRVRELAPDARLGLLAGRAGLDEALKEAEALACESVHQSVRRLERAWVEAAHAAGRRLLAYTVNAPEELRRLEGMGVDAVFSDHPGLQAMAARRD